jgi:iron complex transport system substrate-binding protein
MSVNAYYPKRIVCLSHDSVETLLALDAKKVIVGRPAGCREDVLGHIPTVGRFGDTSPDKVIALNPDLVIGYSDFHHWVVEQLVSRHVTVLAQNHTDIDGILQSVLMLGGMVGRPIQGMSLVQGLKQTVSQVATVRRRRRKPRVYFEEWPDPITCGTRWISQMIDVAGGADVFAERSRNRTFSKRTVTEAEVVALDPEIIVVSWCGRPFDRDKLIARPEWHRISAVKAGRIFEMKGSEILQPGPRIVEGLQRLHHLISIHWEEEK